MSLEKVEMKRYFQETQKLILMIWNRESRSNWVQNIHLLPFGLYDPGNNTHIRATKGAPTAHSPRLPNRGASTILRRTYYLLMIEAMVQNIIKVITGIAYPTITCLPAYCLLYSHACNGTCGGMWKRKHLHICVGKAKCRAVHFNDGNKIKMVWFEWKWWCWKPNAGCSTRKVITWNWNGTIVASGWSGRRFAIAFKDIEHEEQEGWRTAILFRWPRVIFLALQIVHQAHMDMDMDYSGIGLGPLGGIGGGMAQVCVSMCGCCITSHNSWL